MRELYFYHELEDMYEEMLTDCYGAVNVCGYDYDAGGALRLLDDCAFRCVVSDWVSEEFEELYPAALSEEEREHYMVSDEQVVWGRVE